MIDENEFENRLREYLDVTNRISNLKREITVAEQFLPSIVKSIKKTTDENSDLILFESDDTQLQEIWIDIRENLYDSEIPINFFQKEVLYPGAESYIYVGKEENPDLENPGTSDTSANQDNRDTSNTSSKTSERIIPIIEHAAKSLGNVAETVVDAVDKEMKDFLSLISQLDKADYSDQTGHFSQFGQNSHFSNYSSTDNEKIGKLEKELELFMKLFSS